MTKVKICGITNLRDAKGAVDSGADALGFVFAESPRQVSVKTARDISRSVGPWTATVGVFVNETAENILRIASECHLSAIQLHGDEAPGFLSQLSDCRLIKAFRVSAPKDLAGINAYQAGAYLFDTKVSGAYGGSGKSFDWKILKTKSISKSVILSGGLNPKNVKEAVRMLRPYGVDVSSGVEKSPGKKDLKLVKEFIRNAKTAS